MSGNSAGAPYRSYSDSTIAKAIWPAGQQADAGREDKGHINEKPKQRVQQVKAVYLLIVSIFVLIPAFFRLQVKKDSPTRRDKIIKTTSMRTSRSLSLPSKR
jgi:hypothetical protein